jgi:hypothetical protein
MKNECKLNAFEMSSQRFTTDEQCINCIKFTPSGVKKQERFLEERGRKKPEVRT